MASVGCVTSLNPQFPSSDPAPNDANPNGRPDIMSIGKVKGKTTGFEDRKLKDREIYTLQPLQPFVNKASGYPDVLRCWGTPTLEKKSRIKKSNNRDE